MVKVLQRSRGLGAWLVRSAIFPAAYLTTVVTAADDNCTPQWDVSIGQPGADSVVSVLMQYNGSLIAGGPFTEAGGQPVNGIARWDESSGSWKPFVSNGEIGVTGSPFPTLASGVAALTVYNGNLIAGGSFTHAGGEEVNHIARWDGSAWHPLASGGQVGVNQVVRALSVYDGDLLVGGWFDEAGGQTVNYIARWDGWEWHPIVHDGQIGVGGAVNALAEYMGDLVVGGAFMNAGNQSVSHIARWDGSTWHPFVSGNWYGVNHMVVALTEYKGDLIAGGSFVRVGGDFFVGRIARWDGSAWHPLASGDQVGVDNMVLALSVHNGDLFVGGWFTVAGGQTVNHIARWDGNEWSPLGSGMNGPVSALASSGDGSALYAGGQFTSVGAQTTNHIAKWHAPPQSGPADLNCDGVVNVFDLLDLLAAWGECDDCSPDACPADLDGDCTVNVFDLLTLLAKWG